MSIGVRCCGNIARSIETQFYFHSFIPRIFQSAILPYKINMIRVDIDFLEEALQERMIESAENIGG